MTATMIGPTDTHTVAARIDAGQLTAQQEQTIALLEQPRTVRRSHTTSAATVYVYHQMSVVRYLIDDDGSVISSEQFRAGTCDRNIRRQLLAELFGECPEEGQHDDH